MIQQAIEMRIEVISCPISDQRAHPRVRCRSWPKQRWASAGELVAQNVEQLFVFGRKVSGSAL